MSIERFPVRTEMPDAERLRHLCLTILGLFDGAGTAPTYSTALTNDLARAMGSGIDEIANGLRHEAEAIKAAIANIQNLPSRYIATPFIAFKLVQEFQSAQTQAEEIAKALGGRIGIEFDRRVEIGNRAVHVSGGEPHLPSARKCGPESRVDSQGFVVKRDGVSVVAVLVSVLGFAEDACRSTSVGVDHGIRPSEIGRSVRRGFVRNRFNCRGHRGCNW